MLGSIDHPHTLITKMAILSLTLLVQIDFVEGGNVYPSQILSEAISLKKRTFYKRI